MCVIHIWVRNAMCAALIALGFGFVLGLFFSPRVCLGDSFDFGVNLRLSLPRSRSQSRLFWLFFLSLFIFPFFLYLFVSFLFFLSFIFKVFSLC